MIKTRPLSFYWFNMRLGQATDYTRYFEYPRALELLEIEPGRPLSLLDVGSGRLGQFPLFLASRFPFLSVCSSDPRDDFSEQRRHITRLGLDQALQTGRLRLEQMDILSPVFGESSFDRITCISTIEHIPEAGDSEAIRQMARLLKPSGRLVLSVPFNFFRSGDLYRPERAYAIGGEPNLPNRGRQFFERVYDASSFQERLLVPSGLRLERAIYFGEPGFSFGRFIHRGYRKHDAFPNLLLKMRAIQVLIPWISGVFLKEISEQDYDAEDWSGVGMLVSLKKNP